MALFGSKKKAEEIKKSLEARPRRVLLVDDDDFFLRTLTDMLGRGGYETTGVRSGREALARADLARYDIVIADVVMPDMDGLSFLAGLRKLPVGLTLKVVLMTGTDPTPLRPEAERLGCVGFLTKPIDDRIVLDTLQSLLR